MVQVAETLWEENFDAAGHGVDTAANVLSQGNEQFTFLSVDGQQWRAGLTLSRKIDVADLSQQNRSFAQCTGRRSDRRSFRGKLKYRAADEVSGKVGAERKNGSLLPGNHDVESTEFFGIADGLNAMKMEDALAGVIAVDPEGAESNRACGARIRGKKELLSLRETLRKIGEKFSRDFALIAARSQDAGDGDERIR